MIVIISGLPGSGKTSLAKEICRRTNAILLNADEIRSGLSSDLGFSIEDRKEQARRIGSIAKILSDQGHIVVADFVNPTKETRQSFDHYDFFVFVNRIRKGNFQDTNEIWEDPEAPDLTIYQGLSVEEEAGLVLKSAGIPDWTMPTTLQLGRYQPWHEGHSALYLEANKRTNQVLIGVRNTEGTSDKDPLSFESVKEYIQKDKPDSLILKLPNITNIVYGRDVGYNIEYVDLPPEIQKISATEKRKEMGI
jgi:hypothetical protein